ncbi:hypothetical protein ABFS82_04G078000 [Erythranthe guttata]
MANVTKASYIICITLFYASIVLIFTTTPLVSAQCQGDFQGLIQNCAQYVRIPGPKVNPSQECCNVIRGVDIPCICQHLTQKAESFVSLEKAAFVTAFCGKPLAPGTKCGSYTVPSMV